MKVIEIRHIEDCFDGSLIKELLFSEKISRNFIYALNKKGDIQYFAHFSRPFFKIRVNNIYDIKGIEGSNSVRIHLKNPANYTIEDFIKFIEKIY